MNSLNRICAKPLLLALTCFSQLLPALVQPMLVLPALTMLLPTTAAAQLPQVTESRLGVDLVKLESGKRLYGFALIQRPDRSVQFAVERKWLKGTHPGLYDEFAQLERDRFAAVRQQRIDRIEAWIADRPDDRGLLAFLDHELARFQDATEDELQRKRFLIVELTQPEYRELVIQPPDRRKVAGLAFQHELDAVNITPASQLKKQLVEAGVDIESEEVDLSKEVAATVTESDRQWSARRAIVEHVLRAQIEFQGTGSVFVRKSETPDASALIAQMMGGGLGSDPISQIGAELGLPEFKKREDRSDGWWKRSAEQAERDGFRGVTITRLEQNALSSIVRVETHFFAMEKPGEWFRVANFVGSANTAEVDAEKVKRIAEDPQVKSILDTLQGIGLANQSLIDQALRHGAATDKALQDASGEFNAFMSKHARELDSSPLILQP